MAYKLLISYIADQKKSCGFQLLKQTKIHKQNVLFSGIAHAAGKQFQKSIDIYK